MKRQLALAITDTKNITRDSTLILLVAAPLAVFALLRFGIPFASTLLMNQFAFNLLPYYDIIVGFLILIPAMLFGILTGFLILDERDEDIIAYISITPLGKTGYLQYKLAMSCFGGGLFFFVLVYGTGLTTVPLVYAPGIALMVSLEAPLTALGLVAFAENKIEGLAYTKVLGIPILAPIPAYFIHSAWNYLLGVFPAYWVTKSFFAAQQHAWQYVPFLIIGIAVHLFYLYLLLKRFSNQSR